MRTRIIASLVLMAAFCLPLAAQQAAPPPGGDPLLDEPVRGPLGADWENQDLRELVETVMFVRLSRKLELDDKQTVMLMRRFDEMQDKGRELQEERQSLLDDLRESVNDEADDAKIEEQLRRLKEIDRELFETRMNTIEEAGQDLTPAQRAKLYVFAQDFRQDMHRLVDQARQRRGVGQADAAGPLPVQPGAGQGEPPLRGGRDNLFGDEGYPPPPPPGGPGGGLGQGGGYGGGRPGPGGQGAGQGGGQPPRWR